MLAVLGYVVPELFTFPGEIAPGVAFSSVPHGVAAIAAIPALGWMQMFFLIGAVDYYGFLGSFDSGKPDLGAEADTRANNEVSLGMLECVRMFACWKLSLIMMISLGSIAQQRASCHACHTRVASSRLSELCFPRIRWS